MLARFSIEACPVVAKAKIGRRVSPRFSSEVAQALLRGFSLVRRGDAAVVPNYSRSDEHCAVNADKLRDDTELLLTGFPPIKASNTQSRSRYVMSTCSSNSANVSPICM